MAQFFEVIYQGGGYCTRRVEGDVIPAAVGGRPASQSFRPSRSGFALEDSLVARSFDRIRLGYRIVWRVREAEDSAEAWEWATTAGGQNPCENPARKRPTGRRKRRANRAGRAENNPP